MAWAGRYNEKSKVNKRMRLFAEMYAGDGAAAARAAGYAEKGARHSASKLLRHPGVQAIIAAREEKLVGKHVKSAQQLREWWSGIIDDKEADMDAKLKASMLLGRSLGMFLDRKKLDVDVRHVTLPADVDAETLRAIARGALRPAQQLVESTAVEIEEDDDDDGEAPGPH